MIKQQFKPIFQHFNQVLERVSDALLLHDPEGKLLFVNPAFCHIFGVSKIEILEKGLEGLFSPESLSRFKNKILPEAIRFGIAKDELEGIHQDNTLFPLSISSTPIKDEAGRITAYTTLCRDLSDEIALREQRLHSEKLAAMGQMLAGVAHELNNPLTSVVGFSELLLRKRVSPEIKRQLRRISSEAIRTSKIVQNLLSVVRSHKPEKNLVGINGVLLNVLELKSRQLHVDNIRIIKRLANDSTLPKVIGDYQQLIEVFLNLINNAHQAMVAHRGKGSLSIETVANEGAVIIRVSDTGPGIAKEVRAKLFQAFFTTRAEGCGLGLNICQKIIREHGGNITLESSRRTGSTFLICLPVAAPQFIASPALPASPERPEKPLKIMVIDDEEMILDLQFHLLTQLGHHPSLFKSATEALAALEKNSYDLILSDIKMPRMTGIKFYEKLRLKHPALCERILFITGDVLSDASDRFIKKHTLQVLYKPFVLKQLEALIQTKMENKSDD